MSPSESTAGGRVLALLHIGDLHRATAEAEKHRDLRRIVALANRLPTGILDTQLGPNHNGRQW